MIGEQCTEACAAMPECAVCHKTKHPRGRDPGMYAASGYCAHECPGHDKDPQAGHIWPSEWREHAAGQEAAKADGVK